MMHPQSDVTSTGDLLLLEPSHSAEDYILSIEPCFLPSAENARTPSRGQLRENTDTTSEKTTLAPCFYEAVGQFCAFRQLPRNWDSYDADPIKEDAINAATDLFSDIQDRFFRGRDIDVPFDPLSVPPSSPEKPAGVVPLNDGGLQLEWIGPLGDEIQVQVGPSGCFEYLLILGGGESRQYRESNNVTTDEVLTLIARVLHQ
jgi:hypothetical protein